MSILYRILFLSSTLLLSSLQAYALSFEDINKEITAFERSGQARFAPAGMKKVTAYQGASMIAYEQQQTTFANKGTQEKQKQALQIAISQTAKVLREAKTNAKFFTTQYAKLLLLEKEASIAYVYHHKPQYVADPIVNKYYAEAKNKIRNAIIATEQGQLNQAKKAIAQARTAFNKSIDAALPGLLQQSKRALSQATLEQAKKYAPRLWLATKEALLSLETYNKNLALPATEQEDIQRPEKVGLALETAVYAQAMAIQVKDWRRNSGSYESLTLKAKQDRIALAQALGLPLDYEAVDFDIDVTQLIQHIAHLKQQLQHMHQESEATSIAMQESFEQSLRQQKQEEQQAIQHKVNEIKSAFQSKISTMESTFNSQLASETFETKRHKKLRGLFADEEVEIIANLNGSLMIRTKNIQFKSGSSQVDSKYFNLLSRIKTALMLYPKRNILIVGHTDSVGEEKNNRILSLQRAEAVQAFLVAAKMNGDRIRAFGFGEIKPIASNMYAKGRALNRRIDITIEAANDE